MSDSIVWNDSIEALIKSLGEKALSLSWLHNRSDKHYSYLNNFLAIPTIILSTITGVGTASWGTEEGINFIMAGLSITVSIISTLNSYFAFAKKAEAHRLTAVSYSKLYLQISIELSLPRKKRMVVKEFVKNVSEQVQRLNEISPIIPDIIITEYNKRFKDEPSTISKPECTNGLVSINIYKDLTDGPSTTDNTPANFIVSMEKSNLSFTEPNISTPETIPESLPAPASTSEAIPKKSSRPWK
jgi:hypothetical protein